MIETVAWEDVAQARATVVLASGDAVQSVTPGSRYWNAEAGVAEWLAAGNTITARTPAEILEAARASRLADLKALRDAIQFDAYRYNEHWVDCNATSRAAINEFHTAVLSGAEPFPYRWRSADNERIPLLDRDAWATFYGAGSLHIQATWDAFDDCEDAIKAHPNPASYDLSQGAWPTTRIDTRAF